MKRFVRVIIKDVRGRQLVLRHAGGSAFWNYPGGKVEKGESPEKAAVREVCEEIGVNVLKLKYVTSLCIEISGEKWEGLFYFAEVIENQQPAIKECHKFTDLQFKSGKALRDLCSIPCLLDHVGTSVVVEEFSPSRLLA